MSDNPNRFREHDAGERTDECLRPRDRVVFAGDSASLAIPASRQFLIVEDPGLALNPLMLNEMLELDGELKSLASALDRNLVRRVQLAKERANVVQR